MPHRLDLASAPIPSAIRAVLLASSFFLSLALCPAAENAPLGDGMRKAWLYPADGADLAAIKNEVEGLGGSIASLTPEGRLLIQIPSGKIIPLEYADGVASVSPLPAMAAGSAGILPAEARGMGALILPPEEEPERAAYRISVVKPNELAAARAMLQSEPDALPSQVDNSLSLHFPPIRNQGSQGSCTTWATGYYYCTYTQALDEGLDVSGGDNNHICSPAFLYNIINGWGNGGISLWNVVAALNDIGNCSWAQMPYDEYDYVTWPDEDDWVEALDRRMLSYNEIGGYYGCTDVELEAIKQHLANGNLAVTDTSIYGNWYYDYPDPTAGIDNGVLFASEGGLVGAHAMTIVGYDDDRTYFDGVATTSGAFLIANSWGTWWGGTNTAGESGYIWVAYDYFKADNRCFGRALFNDDRPDYRPQLYAASGINHPSRNKIDYRGGVGPCDSPLYTSQNGLHHDGGPDTAISDAKRVVVDLTDGIPQIAGLNGLELFVETELYFDTEAKAEITDAEFFLDLDGDEAFDSVSSSDPTVAIQPGGNGFATYQFPLDGLFVSPSGRFPPSGPEGGPFAPGLRQFNLENTGGAAIDWSASDDMAWLDLSKPSGTLAPGAADIVEASINSSALGFAPGSYSGIVTFTNETGGGSLLRNVTLAIRPTNTFAFDPIATPQTAHTPFDVTVRAVDSEGETVPAFEGEVNLKALYGPGGEFAIGGGTHNSFNVLDTANQTMRRQAIYASGLMPYPGQITGIAIQPIAAPGLPLSNFTIRMKHTASAYFNSASVWEDSGWTQVYQADETIAGGGWHTLNFSTPFDYNGADNILVDFSYRNSATAPGAAIRDFQSTGGTVAMDCRTNTDYGDPLAWSGSAPAFNLDQEIPCIKFIGGGQVSIEPSVSGDFIGGTWTGSVMAFESANEVRLVAERIGVSSGTSNPFDVLALSDDLLITPEAPLEVSGPQAGALAPDRKDYALENIGAGPIDWTASTGANWIDLSLESGTLLTSGIETVTVSLNPNAALLGPGTHTALVAFGNASSGAAQYRKVSCRIQGVGKMPFFDGFESGTELQDWWTVSGTNGYRTRVDSDHYPNTGAYQLVMDSADGSYSRNEATLTIDLLGYENIVLSFNAKEFGEESNVVPINPFTGGADFDGVAISEDGETWYLADPLSGLQGYYQFYTVDLDSVIASYGLSYSNNFKIRFNQYDNDPIDGGQFNDDGIAIDNIRIEGVLNDTLTLSTPGGLDFGAPEGGDALPAQILCSLSNSESGPLEYAVSASEDWVWLSQDSGVIPDSGSPASLDVGVNANVRDLPAGVYSATLSIMNLTTGVYQAHPIALEVRPHKSFAWSVIASPQTAGAPIGVTVSAIDSEGMTVPAFESAAALFGVSGFSGPVETGTASTTWGYPFQLRRCDARTQTIYLADEIGTAGQIRSLSLNIAQVPDRTVENWTIRMKHTTLDAYISPAWEGAGWTTVYRNDETIDSTGWAEFEFAAPFVYNGADNLMVDFSYDTGSVSAADGRIVATTYPSPYRSVIYSTNNFYGDPLTWSGTTPTAADYSYVPDLRLDIVPAGNVSIAPAVSGPFSAGVWTGQIAVLEEVADVRLFADAGSGVAGGSGAFDVAPPPPAEVTVNQAPGQSDPTNALPALFDVVFDQDVTGFDASDVTIGGTAPGVSFSVSGSGASYVISIDSAAGDGTLEPSIAADVCVGQFGVSNNASTSADNSVTLDRQAPTASLSSASVDPTNAAAISISASFTEPVTGFSDSDIVPVNATVAGFSGSGASYSFNLIPLADGTVSAQIAAGAAADAAGNGNTASTILSRISDRTAPVIALLGDSTVRIEAESEYADAGATALDGYDGDLTSQIVAASDVDTSTPGTYTVTYDVTDAAGNAAEQAVRTVRVIKKDSGASDWWRYSASVQFRSRKPPGI
jgi:C1A family cysteine protease